MKELLKNIFAIQKYFQEINTITYHKVGNVINLNDSPDIPIEKERNKLELDGEVFSLEYLGDLETQLHYIQTKIHNLIELIYLNREEKL